VYIRGEVVKIHIIISNGNIMKKFITALLFCLAALPAYAASSWFLISESADGQFKYSFKAEPAKLKEGYVHALMSVTNKKKKETVYYLLRISQSACDAGYGTMSYLTLDGNFAFSGQFAGGTTIADNLATALCSTIPYLQAPAE
jgi:hypothetical protein